MCNFPLVWPAIVRGLPVLFLLGAPFVSAQSPVDNQLVVAMNSLEQTFTACNNRKFLECIGNLEKQGLRVVGNLARTVDGRNERTEIKVNGNLTQTGAQFVFNLDANSYQTPFNPPAEFWRTETFAAVPGQAGSGVLAAWLPPNLDDNSGDAFGVLICGNLTVNFNMSLFGSGRNAALVDATQVQIRAVMQMVGTALLNSGACNGAGELTVNPAALEFSSGAGASNPPAQTVNLMNPGSSSLNWQASVSTDGGAEWLKLNPASGALTAGQTVPLSVTVDKSNLQPGTYQGTIEIAPVGAGLLSAQQLLNVPAGSRQIRVTLTVQGLQLAQTIAARNAALTLGIRGTGFKTGSLPAFLKADGTEDSSLSISDVQILSASEMKADLFVAHDAALGPRVLGVRSGSEETRLANALQVVDVQLEFNQGAKGGTDDDRVAGHATVVRAYIGATDLIRRVTGLLYVYRGAGQISGSPIRPNAPPPLGRNGQGQVILQNTVDAKSSYDPMERKFLRNSLNFYFMDGLPAGSYKFFLALSAMDPSTPPPEIKDLLVDQIPRRKDFIVSEDLTAQAFVATQPLRVLLLVDNRLPLVTQNLIAHTHQLSVQYLRAAYPIDASQVLAEDIYDLGKHLINIDALKPATLNPNSYGDVVNAKLAEILRKRNAAAASTQGRIFDRIALITESSFGSPILGDDSGLSDKQSAVIVKEYPATLAHEIGHTFGLGESYCGSCNVAQALNPSCYLQPVNCRRPDAIDGRIGNADDSGNRVEDGAVRLSSLIILGRANVPIPLVSVSASVDTGNINDAVGQGLGFFQRLALMGKAGNDNDRWPELREWNHLQLRLKSAASGFNPQFFQPLARNEGFLTVHGLVSAPGEALLTDVFHSAAAGLLGEDSGDLRLELLDAASVPLSAVAFGVAFIQPEAGLTIRAPFQVSIPYVPTARQLRLTKGAQVLVQRAISANSPAVRVTAPAVGQAVAGPVTIRWAGTDPDGDALQYSIFYLPDGVNPRPIASGLTETSFLWDPASSPGGTAARLLIQASDGFNESSALSDPFVVAKAKPIVSLFSPPDGVTLPAGTEIIFSGAGSDPEDGYLSPAALSFRSTLDGELGTGNTLTRILSIGAHRITLRGIDQDGNTAEASRTVTVVPAGTMPILDSISPERARPGNELILGGQDLNLNGLTATIGSQSVSLRPLSPTQATVTVPIESLPGRITVALSLGTAVTPGLAFEVVSGKPRLSSLEPEQGSSGTVIILHGAELETTGEATVHFGSTPAQILSRGRSALIAAVPDGLAPGNVEVRVETPAGSSEPWMFRITAGGPSGPVTLQSIVPDSGPGGTSIRLKGAGFSTLSGHTQSSMGGLEVIPTVVSAEELTLTVPSTLPEGKQMVLVSVAGYPSNPMEFSVQSAPVSPPHSASVRLYNLSLHIGKAVATKDGTLYNLELSSLPLVLPANGELYSTFDTQGPSHASGFRLTSPSLPEPIEGDVSVDLPLDLDRDHDGVPDLFEVSQSLPETLTGGFYTSDFDFGDVEAIWSRSAGNQGGTCQLRLTSEVVAALPAFTASFQVQEFLGSLAYQPNSGTVKSTVVLVQSGSPPHLLQGSITFRKSDANSLNELNWDGGALTNQSGQALVFGAGILERSSALRSSYFGDLTFTDGDLSTSSEDYFDWRLAITDPSDSDRDGIPDLTDPPTSTSSGARFLPLRLEGNSILLEWDDLSAHLQTAVSITGPWADAPASAMPVRITPGASRQFFRLVR